jgi:hypothetical protein
MARMADSDAEWRGRRLKALFVVGAALTIASFAIHTRLDQVTEMTPNPNSPIYPVPHHRAEVLLNGHDGTFFAAVAADPLLRRPDDIGPEVAQRASRPLFSWLAWLAAFGDRRRIASALMVLTAMSVATLVAAMIYLGHAMDRDGTYPLVLCVLGAPGILALFAFPGLNDALGTALALTGLGAWRRGRSGLAVAAFGLAGLCHEALLVFPAAVLIHEVVRSDRRNRSDAATSVTRWLVAFVPYLAWSGYVRVRVGAWPTSSRHGNLDLPFVGLASAIHNRWLLFDVACFAVIVLAGAVTWIRFGNVLAVRLVVIGFAGVGVLLGPYIWARFLDYGRVLLPVCALAIVGLLPSRSQPDLSSTCAK